MKKLLVLLLCVIIVLGFTVPASAMADETESAKLVYAKVPDGWANPHIWAFVNETGAAAFDSWPGQALTKDENDVGWYYTYVPKNIDKIIISANEATIQTEGDAIEVDKNVWVTVGEDKSVDISYDKKTTSELPTYVPMISIKAFVPTEWTDVNYWAWSHPDGTNAFANWPGASAKLESDGWYSLQVPAFVNKIIINANLGEVQTADLDVDGTKINKDKFIPTIYVVVDKNSEDIKKPNGEVSYGEKPDVTPKFAVHAKIPETWALPCLWAWSHPDGTNAFANWPGMELTQDEDGEWYTGLAPEFVNRIIINGNLGEVQTIDYDIEAKEVWVIINEANAEGKFEATISYEKPSEKGNAMSVGAWIAIVAGVAVVVAVVIVVVAKKKKSN